MVTCEKCGYELKVGDYPFCSKDGSHQPGRYSVQSDEIPGGIWMEHGVCNDDGTPRKFYSKSEIARVARERGLMNLVEHVPERGTDKSKFTTRWI